MPYTKIRVHLIWATKNRDPLLSREIRSKLFDHIRENAHEKNIHIDFINGYAQHVHLLVSLRPDQSISKVVQLKEIIRRRI